MSKINKIITNYPVSLTNDEVENLSLTLSAVRTSGSNNEGKIYYGDGFVNVNNTSNIISLTTEATEKLNQPIPTKVSELTDSASYQTVVGMEDYSTKGYVDDASANALSQAEAWVKTQKYLTSIPDSYALKTDIPTAVVQLTDSGNYYQKTETSGISELNAAFESKQDNLTQEQLSAISSVSSIKGTILAGDANIRTTSAEDGNNIKWTIELTAQPVVTDTTLNGYDGIVATKDSTIDSQWNVGISQAYKEQIEAVSSKLTQADADTLYAPISVASNYVTKSELETTSGELLTTAQYKADSATFLTEHQSLDNYATKEYADNASANALSQAEAWVETQKYLKEIPDTYALKADIPTTVTQLTDSGNYYQKTETSGKTEIANALTTKVDKPSQTGKLVYDGDSNAWVTLPECTATVVQGQGSVTSNYDSSNSTYTVSLLASAENALNKVDDKIDTTAVEQTYQTISDMSNYLTTSDASTAYQPKGNYATTSAISDMATKTWVGQQGFIKKDANDLTYYYKKTETSGANELATEFAKYVSTGDILTAANDTLTGIKIGSTSYKVPTTDLSNYYTKSETSATGELNAEFAKKLDSTIASSTYQTIIGMSAYLTTAAASQTYLDKITYASDSATFVTSATVTSNDGKYVLTKTGWQLVTIPTKVADLTDSANYVVTGDILTGTGNTLTGIKIGNTDYKIPDDYAKPSGNYQNLSAGSATSAYSAYSANHATAADIATSAYINANTISAMSAIVDELHGKLDSTAISDMLTKTEATQTYQPKGTYATETYTNEASANALSEAKTWVEGQDFLKNTDLTGYAMKTYVDTASAEALSQAKTWTNQQNFVTSAGLADNTRYEMTNTGWTSAIKIQVDSEVPTANDGVLHIILES